MKRYDVVILGAGPAGSSAAYFLAEMGFSVAIVEKSRFPRKRVCGEFVSATTFPVLEAMGLGEALGAFGGPLVHKVGVYGGKTMVVAPMPAANSSIGWGRALSRAQLDPMILESAKSKGTHVFQPWKAVSIDSTPEGHLCTLRSEAGTEELLASIVVAAHGSWELGSFPTQPARSHLDSDLFAFKAFFQDAKCDQDLMTLLAFPGGYGGMVHSASDVVGLSCCVRRDVLEQCRERYRLPSAGESFLRHVFNSTVGVSTALTQASLLGSPIAAGPLRPGIRPRYEKGIFRVGNAAGEAHPVIAEGISMAIQSGLLLATHMKRALGQASDQAVVDAIGYDYSEAWMSHFGGRIRASEVYSKLCMNPIANRLLAPLLTAIPGILTFGAVLSGKTKLLPTPAM